MSVISWIILGVIAGFLGSKIVNRSGQGILMDIVLGIVGAVVGGLIFSAFGASGVTTSTFMIGSRSCTPSLGAASLKQARDAISNASTEESTSW